MDNQELYEKLKNDYCDGFEAVIENIKDEINEKVGKKIDGLEEYVGVMVELLEKLVEK